MAVEKSALTLLVTCLIVVFCKSDNNKFLSNMKIYLLAEKSMARSYEHYKYSMPPELSPGKDV